MSAKLICLKGPYAGQEFPIEGQGIVLGRDPATASVILNVSSVSRSHANVFLSQDGRVILQDLRSTNGTFLVDASGGKTKVQGDTALTNGQRFSLGNNDDIVFEISGFEQAAQPAASDASEPTRAYFGDSVYSVPKQPAPAAPGSYAPAPGGGRAERPGHSGVNMRGTSNAPLILGIVGSVLMIPGVFCSACIGGFGGGLASGGRAGGFKSGMMKGVFLGALPIISGIIGAVVGKSKPVFSFILLLLAALIAGSCWFATLFTNLFYLSALILYLVGAIVALVQKKEPDDAG